MKGPRHERPRRRRPAPAGSPAGPDRGPHHAAVPAVRGVGRFAGAVHRDRVHRHALLLARAGLAPRAGHAGLRVVAGLGAFHAKRAGAGTGAQCTPARRVGLPRAVREDGPAGLDTRRGGAITRRCAQPGTGLPPLHQSALRARGELPDRLGLHGAGVPRAAAGAGPDPAAVPDGGLHRPGGWPCAPRRARLRRRARIGLRLPPGESQPDAAGGAALGHLPGVAGQRASAADSAAQRGAAGRSGVHRVGDVQEVPVAASAAAAESGGGPVPIDCGAGRPAV
mmetsp:Transcript_26289/g.62319  ORF Transcript_26289/g.62319 Transcript_26289/m.62319 type:complete len:281 (+) Transcript_26289:3030-3872(+)